MGQRAQYDQPEYRLRDVDPSSPARRILNTEFSEFFIDSVRSRVLAAYYAYGPTEAGCPEKTDILATLRKKLEQYEQSGNAEWLIDVAKDAMIEFMYPSHSQAHFQPTPITEVVGRIRRDGSDPFAPYVTPTPAAEKLEEKIVAATEAANTNPAA